MFKVSRKFAALALVAALGTAAPAFAVDTPGAAFTNTAVPAFTDVATSCIATLGPVLTTLIGAGVLVAAVWMVYKVICLIFGAKPKGAH